jgi:hypothetical protein
VQVHTCALLAEQYTVAGREAEAAAKEAERLGKEAELRGAVDTATAQVSGRGMLQGSQVCPGKTFLQGKPAVLNLIGAHYSEPLQDIQSRVSEVSGPITPSMHDTVSTAVLWANNCALCAHVACYNHCLSFCQAAARVAQLEERLHRLKQETLPQVT